MVAGRFAKQKKEMKRMMEKYCCQVCGHIYDPAEGDPDGGISPGIAFTLVPDTWHCPVCRSSKGKFSQML